MRNLELELNVKNLVEKELGEEIVDCSVAAYFATLIINGEIVKPKLFQDAITSFVCSMLVNERIILKKKV